MSAAEPKGHPANRSPIHAYNTEHDCRGSSTTMDYFHNCAKNPDFLISSI